MPMWDGKESQGTGKRVFPRQKLTIWFQSKLPDLEINNFTTDWNDGRAVGALVDALAPGLCPDWQDWNPKDAVQNASKAMGLADDWLNIPPLIKPEEIVDPNIDEMSMMTYLSRYLNAKLKSGAPLRPPINRNRVCVYGPGIKPNGPFVGVQANFTVETFSAGKGNVEVTVEDPEGNKIPADVHFNNDKNLTYSVSYTPKLEGPHKIKILFAGREAGDAGKVTASGPGLQPEGIIVNKPTFFEINTKDAGRGVPEVIILPPQGVKASIPVKLHQTLLNVWRCDYISPVTGLHSVNIFFAGKLIPGSPCGVNVVLASDAKKCRAYGRGILPNGVRVQDDADFVIVTKGASEDVPGVKVIGPEEVNHPVNMTKIDDKTYECHYTPIKEGRHVVMITYGGQEIHKSPFEVNVGPYKESAIRVFGPGLYTGIVDYPAKFTVDTSGETGGLGFSIEGPSKAKITCRDTGDGTGDVSYLPTAPGRYAIHILGDNEDIPKSPYVANILPKADFDPHKVEVYPSGFQSKFIPCGKPTVFTIDVTKAGQAPLEVAIQDALGWEVQVHLDDKHDGTVQCSFTPTSG